MNLLVLGGTRFVGRHMIEAGLAAGHTISILTRGQSPDELPTEVERLQGDRNQDLGGLHALSGRTWDACIDTSGYTPKQVRASTELLKDSVQHYLFISTGSVYDIQTSQEITEDHPLLSPANEDITQVTNENYGHLKVACEQIVLDTFPESSTILRPQIVAGPYDYTKRYPYWIDRAARGGRILAPGDGSDFVQVIDARDLAKFTLKSIEESIFGIFDVAGPRLSWQAFLETLEAKDVIWIDANNMEKYQLGFEELPLYLPQNTPFASLMNISAQKALKAGLSHTPPAITARDTCTWSQDQALTYALSADKEANILKQLTQQQLPEN